jgi:Amt family ammonium transporter
LINPDAANGLFFGDPAQLGTQAAAVVVTIVYSFVVSLIILWVVKAVMGLRVTEEEEVVGVDTSVHGEAGYNL